MTTTSQDGTQPSNAPGDLAGLEKTLKDVTTVKKPDPAAKPDTNQNNSQAAQRPDWIQEKFWTGDLNESAQKQAQAYPSLQSAYGRMANDLGSQRKLTDQILSLDKRSKDLGQAPAAPQPPKVDPKSLVNDPTGTLDAYWKQREEVLRQEMEAREQANAAARAETDFNARHSDFGVVTADPKFVAWVQSSPLRRRAAALAGQGNFVVADELLTEYKALNGQAPQTSADPNRGQTQQTEAARAATLETSAQASGGQGKGGPIYRRADLIQLKMEKPDVYADPAFQAEILRAYAQGRVR